MSGVNEYADLLEEQPAQETGLELATKDARIEMATIEKRIAELNVCDAPSLELANNSLIITARLQKDLEKLKKAELDPLNQKRNEIFDFFGPLEEKLKAWRNAIGNAITVYRAMIKRRQEEEMAKLEAERKKKEEERRKAEEASRAAAEEARKKIQAQTGADYGDLTDLFGVEPVVTQPEKPPAPATPPPQMKTNLGTVQPKKRWTWEITDFHAMPDDYKTWDAGKLTRAVQSGVREIPGVKIEEKEELSVR